MARIVMSPGYERKVKFAAAGEVHEIARDIAADVRGNIRSGGHVDSGALVRSVRVRRDSNGDSHVYIGTDHWMMIEYGAAAHTITAPPGHVLRFTKANGEVVFTKYIRHPGNRAYAVVRRAVYKRRG